MAEEQIPDQQNGEVQDPELEYDNQKSKKMLYIIIFVVQLIVAVVLVKFFLLPWYSEDTADNQAEEQVTEEQNLEDIGQIYKMPSLTVNPKGSRGRRFAVFEIAFSLPEGPFVEEIKKFEPVLTDRYIQYFREKTVIELSNDTIMTVLKTDIISITEDIIGQDKIIDMYFTNFILQ